MHNEVFSHRQLEDGSVQSVCLYCFFTVAISNNEMNLQVAESRHWCEQRRIVQQQLIPALDSGPQSGKVRR